MAFTQVQNIATNNAATSSVIITPPAPLTVNNLVVLGVRVNAGAATLTDVSDTAGNTYTTVKDQVGVQGANHYLIYGVQVTGGATFITLNFSATANIRVALGEYSGGNRTNATVLETSSSGNAGSGTSHAVTLFNPSANNLVVAIDGNQNQAGSYTVGAGYTLGATNTGIAQQYLLASSGAETAPISYSNDTLWVEIAASFRLFGTSGGGGNLRRRRGIGV